MAKKYTIDSIIVTKKKSLLMPLDGILFWYWAISLNDNHPTLSS